MPRKYPPLKRREVIEILKSLGFKFLRQESTHAHYDGLVRGNRHLVTVDTGYSEFDGDRVKTMIAQSGVTREEFYGATGATARKIGKR